jgi:hypothetical protein
MPEVRRASLEELTGAFEAEVLVRCAIAFEADCRLAVFMTSAGEEAITYEFVVLSPGEAAPRGWTVYENRDGVAVGRTA